MVILDLLKWEGFLISDIELKDDETGEIIPPKDITGMIESLHSEGWAGPWRFQVVRDGPTYLLFPLDKPGNLHYWPKDLNNFVTDNLAVGETLTFHDLYTELQQLTPGTFWGSIPKSVDGAILGHVTLVSCLSNGSYDAITWGSLDGRFTVHWANNRISLTIAAQPAISIAQGGTRFAYNQ